MKAASRWVLPVAGALLFAAVAVMWIVSESAVGELLPEPRFFAIDVFIDSGDESLAAWQVDIRDTRGLARLTAVEGGEHEAFREPPHYDAKALRNHRVVLIAYDLGQSLPTGRTRVATLHYTQERAGQPMFDAVLVAAANPDGRALDARVEIEP